MSVNKFVLPRRRALILSGGALAAPMIASGVARAADDWPNKPVKYINLFPAGGPAGLPQPMVDRLNALSKQALDSPDVKSAYIKNGATPLWKSVADTVAYRRSEEARFAPIVTASGASVD